MKKWLLFLFTFISLYCCGQGGTISITSTVPNQITVCGEAKAFTVSIYNPSPFSVTNDTLKITMPVGISYQAGSVSGTGVSELNISTPNKPVFLLPPIASLTPALTITFMAKASCDVINYIGGGGVIENTIAVSYSANGQQSTDNATTLTYAVKQPVLAITNITNQSFSGTLGNTFTRCITITNSGLGELSQFSVTDVHGNGIAVTTVNGGTWSNSGTTETITFGASHFGSIGNNNATFDPGESITFCETVQINGCIGVASDFTASWGCNNQVCQSSTLGANVVFPNLIPNVEITPVGPPMNACLGTGNASVQKLMIVNSGLGRATNIQLDIFQTNNGALYNNNMGSYIDVSSVTTQLGNATPVPLTPDSTTATSTLSCMPVNAVGRMYITIPTLNAGDTLYLSWNTYTCCYNSCTSTGQSYFNGWAYQGKYSNICQGVYIIATAWGRVHSQLFATMDSYNSSSVLDSGQTGIFNFRFTSYGFQQPYPGDTSAHWKLVYTIPPCLINPNLRIINFDNSNTWLPTSVNVSGNTITAIFSEETPPFDLNMAQIKLNLFLDCNGCTGGESAVDLKLYYVPSTSCSCEVNVACGNTPVTILCSPGIITPAEPSEIACPQGMMLRYYTFKRSSFGLPDNEPNGGDGIPDIGGTLNQSQIKTSIAMFGDTIANSFHGKVRTSIAHPSWQYCYASSEFSSGNLLSYANSDLYIYRNGNLIVTCSSFTPTITNSGTSRTFAYDLSTSGLISSGCMPSGFVYSNNDSVIFVHRYKITQNTTGPIVTCNSFNNFYVSDIPNPTSGIDKYQCDGISHWIYITGYKFETKENNYYTVHSCDTTVISQQYLLSVGPCCNNYDGGNLFMYEYRNWAYLDTLKARIPSGYSYVSAQFTELRTAGYGTNASSGAIPIAPLNPNSDTLIFPIQPLYQNYGGVIPLSDDGFSGTLDIKLVPSCRITPALSQGVKYDCKFNPTNYLTGTGSQPPMLSTTADYLIYDAPALFMQAVLSSTNTPDSIAVWDITITNTSNTSNAENTWLSAPTISGVTVIEVINMDDSTTVTPTGSFYHLGTTPTATVRNFRIKALYSSCSPDSIVLYSGWDCVGGYPTTIASYPCTPQKITLTENPLLPAVDMIVSSPSGNVQLCDTITYTITGINLQLGTLYNPLFTTILPVGTSIVPNSSSLLYPTDSVFVAISDPVFQSGTTWQWNIADISNLIQTNGLKGSLDTTLNSFKIKFRLVTNCNMIAGNSLHFKFTGNTACGLTISNETVSAPINIAGANAPYSATISMQSTFITPCSEHSPMHVSIVNNGAAATGTTDSITIIIPTGVVYETGSFAGVHNAPTTTAPLLYTLNNQQIAKWPLPNGVQANDSIVFNFNYTANPDEISCGITNFTAHTQNSANVLCTSSGNSCNIGVITGTDTLPVFTYKAYLTLSNASGYTVPSPPNGEAATINLTINNSGQDILQSNNTYISYYSDVDGNGIYSTGDTLIAIDTLNSNIPGNDSFAYTGTIFVPAGKACKLIAVIDTSINNCTCVGSQIGITLPLHNVSSDTSVCSGQAITLGFAPVNGYNYLWTPATGLDSVNNSLATYTAPTVTGTPISTTFYVTNNRINCTTTDTIQLTINPNPQVLVTGSDTICFGDSTGTAIATLTTAIPANTYTWSTIPSQTNDTAIGLSGGTYTVTVIDTNGCSATGTFTIHQTASPVIVNISNQNNLLCSNACNGSATATATGGAAGYTYSWNTTPVQTSATANNLCIGNHTVTVTDAVGCSADTVITITAPIPIMSTIALTNATCNSSNNASASLNTSGGTAPYTYLWNNGQTNPTVNGLSAGIYTVITSDANNCTKNDTIIISPAVNATIGAIPNSICQGQSAILSPLIATGTPTYSFLWNTADTTQSITVSPTLSSSYAVVITDANGCTDSAFISITVREQPHTSFNSDTIGCSPLCIQFNNQSSINTGTITQWHWNFGDGGTSNIENPVHCFTNPDATSILNSTVSLTVSSNEGCADTLTKNNYITIYPAPIADFDYTPNPPTILNNVVSFQNTSISSNAWIWSFSNNGNDTSTTLQSPYYTYLDTGVFTVTLIASNNYSCKDTIQKNIVVGSDWALYIPNAFTPENEDGINDIFLAKGYGILEFEMLIFDRWGNLIFKSDDITKGWDGKANAGKEPAQPDVYVYTVKANDIYGNKHKYRGTVTLVR